MSRSARSNLLLLSAAAIWGFAFVGQRAGMDHVGPFTFGVYRFLLGGLVLVPLVCGRSGRRERRESPASPAASLAGGSLAGVALFAGISCQQIGLMTTTAGKGGFLTGLSLVLVPVFGLALGQRVAPLGWLGAAAAIAGLYLLTLGDPLHLVHGDLWVLAGAGIWAVYILLIDRLVGRIGALHLAFVQYVVCFLLNVAVAAWREPLLSSAILEVAVPVLYVGVLSTGVGFTLQFVGQRHARPAHAAILLSLEAVFAAAGGWLLLGETLSARALAGCALMLAGMMFSQLGSGAAGNLSADPVGGA